MHFTRALPGSLVIFAFFPAAILIASDSQSSGNFGFSRPIQPQYFPEDPRQWRGYGQSVLLTDLSQVQPSSALNTGRREFRKWKVLPYETKEFKGNALSIYQPWNTNEAPIVPPVRIKVGVTGWHAVYVGLSTVSAGLDAARRSGVRAKLGSARIYQRFENNMRLIPPRRDVVQELFLTVADLKSGETIEFAPYPSLPATVTHARLVPLTDAERAAWQKDTASPQQRTLVGTMDAHSWIWPYRPRTAEQLVEFFEGLQRSDIGQWWYEVLGADLVSYASKVGTIPGEGTQIFSRWEHEEYFRSVTALIKAGVNPMIVARDAARASGREFHVMIRPAAWGASIPWEETFNSKFYHAHPEWHCVDRDGRQAMFMSYAVPQVRRQVLDILKEAVEMSAPDGVGFVFNRGMPLMLWEKPFADQFRAEYGVDVMSVEAEDPRIHRLRGKIMTGFLRDLRAMLDGMGKTRSGKRYAISAATLAEKRFNERFGLDVETWVKEGLIDQVGPILAHHTRGKEETFTPHDVAYYRRAVAGSNVRVLPFLLSWNTMQWTGSNDPKDLCKLVLKWHKDGADGFGLWDPVGDHGYGRGSYQGQPFDVLGRLEHRELIAHWAEHGVPLPNHFSLQKLGDNEYSAWFPNTGY